MPDQLEIMTKIISIYIIVMYMKSKSKSKISLKILPLPLVNDFLICSFKRKTG